MEDESVKSLNLAARRGALVTVAAASALALASCSAGQVTQTSSQVAAVDGNQAGSANDPVLVRDVTVHLTTDGEAGVKFTAINQDTTHTSHTLESVTVDGEEVELDDAEPIERNCSLVADIQSELDLIEEPEVGCIQHVATSLDNPGFAYGGVVPVEFVFDTGTITIDATVSAPVLESGVENREVGGDTAEASHH
ncbi:hypothetical protein FM102_13475 [Corynebacterium glutamicum]|uniref:hypothetical protein n=1 Tax=Corynebacterium glutamicum TaxID=1718 RepID=UPI00097EF9BA|nr:hypothetical protein [Corynebacterium glutamicum]SJM69841.1 hypothetical protein FM102_13475 [Corynebacterium glutamicum]